MALHFLDSAGVAKLWDLIVAKFAPKKSTTTQGTTEIVNGSNACALTWAGQDSSAASVGINSAEVSFSSTGSTHSSYLKLNNTGAYYTTDTTTYSENDEILTKKDLDEVQVVALSTQEIDNICQ